MHPLLAQTDHRPWPLPRGPWLGRQSWGTLLFAHYRVPAATVRRHVPAPPRIQVEPVREGVVAYSSVLTGGGARFSARYGPDGPPHRTLPGGVEHFLTERYCLYARSSAGRLYRTEVHHLPWPLQPAAADVDA